MVRISERQEIPPSRNLRTTPYHRAVENVEQTSVSAARVTDVIMTVHIFLLLRMWKRHVHKHHMNTTSICSEYFQIYRQVSEVTKSVQYSTQLSKSAESHLSYTRLACLDLSQKLTKTTLLPLPGHCPPHVSWGHEKLRIDTKCSSCATSKGDNAN